MSQCSLPHQIQMYRTRELPGIHHGHISVTEVCHDGYPRIPAETTSPHKTLHLCSSEIVYCPEISLY